MRPVESFVNLGSLMEDSDFVLARAGVDDDGFMAFLRRAYKMKVKLIFSVV